MSAAPWSGSVTASELTDTTTSPARKPAAAASPPSNTFSMTVYVAPSATAELSERPTRESTNALSNSRVEVGRRDEGEPARSRAAASEMPV